MEEDIGLHPLFMERHLPGIIDAGSELSFTYTRSFPCSRFLSPAERKRYISVLNELFTPAFCTGSPNSQQLAGDPFDSGLIHAP
jgi:hypothetical protein